MSEIITLNVPEADFVIFQFEGKGTFACPPSKLFEAWEAFTKGYKHYLDSSKTD